MGTLGTIYKKSWVEPPSGHSSPDAALRHTLGVPPLRTTQKLLCSYHRELSMQFPKFGT
jgi:hypothetical protein